MTAEQNVRQKGMLVSLGHPQRSLTLNFGNKDATSCYANDFAGKSLMSHFFDSSRAPCGKAIGLIHLLCFVFCFFVKGKNMF